MLPVFSKISMALFLVAVPFLFYGFGGETLQHRIELVGCPDRPAAAVDMEIDAARALRRDDAQVELAARPVDRDCRRARGFRRQRKRAEPLQTARAHFLSSARPARLRAAR